MGEAGLIPSIGKILAALGEPKIRLIVSRGGKGFVPGSVVLIVPSHRISASLQVHPDLLSCNGCIPSSKSNFEYVQHPFTVIASIWRPDRHQKIRPARHRSVPCSLESTDRTNQ